MFGDDIVIESGSLIDHILSISTDQSGFEWKNATCMWGWSIYINKLSLLQYDCSYRQPIVYPEYPEI